MADPVDEAIIGLRAALIADAALAALVGERVVDEPAEDIAFPYVRFGDITPVPDDTDHRLGLILQVGLIAYSRPVAGRTEAGAICAALRDALHRRPDAVAVAGYTVTEIEVQTWLVQRAGDGATYEGRLALEVHLDA